MTADPEACVGIRKFGQEVCPLANESRLGACATCAVLLEEYAFKDSLTQLPNRYEQNVQFERLLQSRMPIGAIHIDLEAFGDVNERLGHDIGDQTLAYVGASVQMQIRGSDHLFLSRQGGDEFVILVSLTKNASAEESPEPVPPHEREAALTAIQQRLMEVFDQDNVVGMYNSFFEGKQALGARMRHAILDPATDPNKTLSKLISEADTKGPQYSGIPLMEYQAFATVFKHNLAIALTAAKRALADKRPKT